MYDSTIAHSILEQGHKTILELIEELEISYNSTHVRIPDYVIDDESFCKWLDEVLVESEEQNGSSS